MQAVRQKVAGKGYQGLKARGQAVQAGEAVANKGEALQIHQPAPRYLRNSLYPSRSRTKSGADKALDGPKDYHEEGISKWLQRWN